LLPTQAWAWAKALLCEQQQQNHSNPKGQNQMTIAITATYSPEDNKLRLYASSRLDSETYERVKAAGFKWAPKQELFVTPMWTPSREDLCIELAGEIDDEDTSLVDRAEAKAERLEDLSERRANEADRAHKAVHAIADGIPFGQPILVGHHSERRARKDAERIENGMRKAVDCWKAAEYWKERAAGALHLAKYKERPDVRARRIKGIEAEYRKCDKTQGECLSELKAWSITLMTWKLAKMISGRTRRGFSRCYPLAEYPRPEGASQYEGEMSLYSALGDAPETGIITPEQAQETAIKSLRGHVEVMRRWIDHLQHRLDYERAMLDESGGLVAEQQEIKVGGRVLVGGEWVVVLRVNRKDGKACSFRTARRYVPVVGAEEVCGYEPPSEEQAATVAEAMKKGPLCNYPGERFATCTQAEWDAIYKDHRGSEVIAATETTGTHRVRKAIGFKLHLPAPTGKELEPGYCNANRTHHYWPVFITDAKRKDPPTKKPELPASVDDLTPAMFNHSEETGKIRAGIKFEYANEGEAECYQFDTLEELQECARAYQQQPRMIAFSIVTHSSQYKNMRTVYKWQQPGRDLFAPKMDVEEIAARTERLKASNAAREEREAAAAPFKELEAQIKSGVKVIAAPQLFPTPPALAERMVNEARIEEGHRIMEPSAGTGQILGLALHNRPAVEAIAVEINPRLIDFLQVQHAAGAYPGASFICGDFLEQNGNLGTFDRILMNPPFENGADIKHIQHAMKMLKPGGRLVAICANGPRQQSTLKPLAENSGGWYEDLPAGTFASQGTNVNTAILLIEN
jgi:protein-L-isoaspartate O-methyltransferase